MKIHFPIILCILAGLCPASHAGMLDPAEYPMSDEISYGGVVAQVRPRQYIKFKAPLTGKLHLKVRSGMHEKDTVWAEIEPEQIALERESMDITKSLNELKSKPMLKLEMADSRAALENRRDELRRNLAMMREIMEEPELTDLYLGREGHDAEASHSNIKEMESRLVTQIAAIEEALTFVGTPEQKRAEMRLAEIQIERQDQNLQRKEEESKLRVPFTGEFRFLTDLPENLDDPLTIQSGEDIAEISDYSTLQCEMVVNRAELRQLPTSSLVLEFRNQTGPGLRARFKTQKTVELFGRNELVYVFEFPKELATAARPLIGGRVSADLIVKLPDEAHLVPKLDLVRSHPGPLGEKGWQRGVEEALPGFRVLAVGQSSVAVFPIPSANE